jgi:hypothetical protein
MAIARVAGFPSEGDAALTPPGHTYDHSDEEGRFGPAIAPNSLDLPVKVSNPARNALAHAGIARLEDLNGLDRKAVAKLHGMGPKAMRLLEAALAERGLGFAPEPGRDA